MTYDDDIDVEEAEVDGEIDRDARGKNEDVHWGFKGSRAVEVEVGGHVLSNERRMK
jgi:hypothetical protein